jgi:hypothetical protein
MAGESAAALPDVLRIWDGDAAKYRERQQPRRPEQGARFVSPRICNGRASTSPLAGRWWG